ncbi:hypothetical protein C1I95_34300, partial [Micromonospora craterilacus]
MARYVVPVDPAAPGWGVATRATPAHPRAGVAGRSATIGADGGALPPVPVEVGEGAVPAVGLGSG